MPETAGCAARRVRPQKARAARAPTARRRAGGSAPMKKATPGWPLFSAASARSMHLLDAGEQPAARAVGGLHEVPHFFEAGRRRAGRLAHAAGEAHARPVPVALGRHLEQIGIESLDVGLL